MRVDPPSICPWGGLQPANLTFCEVDRCAWITQPANTWSNIGFLIAGLVVLHLARKLGARQARLLGPIAIATGITSALFHGTGTFVGQAADQSTMFLESALFVTLNVGRWRGSSAARLAALYAMLVTISITLLLRFETIGIVLFVAHIVTFAAIELRLLFRDRETDYRPLWVVVGLFMLSYGLWWLDRLRLVCDPHNHVFTLHAAWHFLGAASFYWWFRFYAQFDRKMAEQAA